MKIEFREKSDRYVYTRLGEKVDTSAVMSYLGKKIPVCYISGAATSDVISAPMDLNVQNILPSNMIYLSRRYLEGEPLTKALNFVTYKHATSSGETVDIVFLVPHYANKKVVEHARELMTGYGDFEGVDLDADTIYALWDQLMFDGLKGLFELRIHRGDTTLMVDYQLTTNYFMVRTQERMKSVSALQLK